MAKAGEMIARFRKASKLLGGRDVSPGVSDWKHFDRGAGIDPDTAIYNRFIEGEASFH